MLAARLHASGAPVQLETVPTSVPSGTEVRIRVAACGVCHTDLHIVDGTQTRVSLPVTLGHEVAGWVEAVGPLAEAEIGRAVVVHGAWGCGTCRDCGSGDEQLCERSVAPGFQADGGYAGAMIVPHPRYLVPLAGVDPVRAAPLADAGLTPYRAVRRAVPWLGAGRRVLVIGAGALGQFAIQYLRLLPPNGHELIVGASELTEERLARAIELGANFGLLDVAADAFINALGGPADAVFDVVGTDSTLALAAAVVRPGGLVMLVGEAGGSLPFGFSGPPVESWLTTVAWGSIADLRDAVRLAEDGRLRWDVEAVPLADVADAHRRLRAGDVAGRLVLVP